MARTEWQAAVSPWTRSSTAGESPERIAQCFPVLSLDQVSGAIGFYLGHRDEVDAYLLAQGADYEAKRAASRAADPAFHDKLVAARRRTSTR
jgi:hypothetical protein